MTGIVPGTSSFFPSHDHCTGRFLSGFRMLALGWSDGASFVPLDHAVLSSRKKKNRIQGITKQMDRRTCGARRRKEALTKSTELILPMVKRALGLFIPAKYHRGTFNPAAESCTSSTRTYSDCQN